MADDGRYLSFTDQQPNIKDKVDLMHFKAKKKLKAYEVSNREYLCKDSKLNRRG